MEMKPKTIFAKAQTFLGKPKSRKIETKTKPVIADPKAMLVTYYLIRTCYITF